MGLSMKKLLILTFLLMNLSLFSTEIDTLKLMQQPIPNFDEKEFSEFLRNNWFESKYDILMMMISAVIHLSIRTKEFNKYNIKISKLKNETDELKELKLYKYLYELGKKINSANPVNPIMEQLTAQLTSYKYFIQKVKQEKLRVANKQQQVEQAELNFEQVLADNPIPSRL